MTFTTLIEITDFFVFEDLDNIKKKIYVLRLFLLSLDAYQVQFLFKCQNVPSICYAEIILKNKK